MANNTFKIGGKEFSRDNTYIRNRAKIAELEDQHGITDAISAAEIFRGQYYTNIPNSEMDEYLDFYRAMRDGDYEKHLKELEEQGV